MHPTANNTINKFSRELIKVSVLFASQINGRIRVFSNASGKILIKLNKVGSKSDK